MSYSRAKLINLPQLSIFVSLMRLYITCELLNSKVNQQIPFSLPSIKCSVAPPSFPLCCLNWAQQCDLITVCSTVVESLEEPPNIWLTVAKNAFFSWPLNLRVCMLLKGAAITVPMQNFSRDTRWDSVWDPNVGFWNGIPPSTPDKKGKSHNFETSKSI